MQNLKYAKLWLAIVCAGSIITTNANNLNWYAKNAGDDGNPNTVGNLAAQKAKSSQKVTKEATLYKFNLVNKTNTVLASAVIKDVNGKIVYTSTKGKTCDINAICTINVKPEIVVNTSTMFLYDANNRLISAYSFFNLPKGGNSVDIQADLSSLGIYVFRKIQLLNPKVTYGQLIASLNDPKLQAVPFAALGDFALDLYAASKNGKGVFNELATELISGKQLLVDPKSLRLTMYINSNTPRARATGGGVGVKSSPDSSSPFCSSGFQSAMNVFGAFGNFQMPVITVVTSLAAGVATEACGKSTTDYSTQLTNISSKLNDISDQLQAISSSVKQGNQDATWRSLGNNFEAYTNSIGAIKSWVRIYFDLLKIKGKDGKTYTTLKELVDSYGGLDMAAENSETKAALAALFSGTQNLQLELGKLNNNTNNEQTVADLQKLCSSSSSITGDALELRGWCNAHIIDVYAANNIYANILKQIIPDIEAVYNESPHKYYAQLPTLAEIEKYNTTFETNFSPNKTVFKAIYNNELPDTMINDIAGPNGKFKCTMNGWYPDMRYIVTTCKVDGKEIKSKYYYRPRNDATSKDVDSEVVNIMGVFVPKRFFASSGQNARNVNAFPWLNWSYLEALNHLDTNPRLTFDDLKVASRLFTPENVTVTSFGYDLDKLNQDTLVANNYREDYTRNGKSYSRLVLNHLDYYEPGQYITEYFGADYWRVGSGSFFSFMRYTDSAGYSYVWALVNSIEDGGSTTTRLALKTTMQCVSNNCTIKEGSASSLYSPSFEGNLIFKGYGLDTEELKIGWQTDTGNNRTGANPYHAYIMTVNGAVQY